MIPRPRNSLQTEQTGQWQILDRHSFTGQGGAVQEKEGVPGEVFVGLV